MRCKSVRGYGRFVVAESKIAAGCVIFREVAYCVAQRIGDEKAPRCVYCCGDAKAAHHVCEICGSAFCTEACMTQHFDAHDKTGECCAVVSAKLARGVVPPQDMGTFAMTCLVLAKCAAEGKEDRLSRTGDAVATGVCDTVGFGFETANPLVFLNTGENPAVVAVPSYDHVECLATNLRDTNPEYVKDFSNLYDVYCALLQKKKYRQRVSRLQHRLPVDVSRDSFVALCTAFLCNGFGIWSEMNRMLGSALYPQSSYFNHSCAPNMGRRNVKGGRVLEFFAARDIEAGEPLCISYVNVKLAALERKERLMATYSFHCSCFRCDPLAGELTANTVCGSYAPALCSSCTSRLMQPIGDDLYVCPCCGVTQRAT